MSTLRDIAKLAGVSIGTVSNVINNVNTVSLDNVNKVQAAMKTLGYVPKASTRTVKSETNRTVHIVLPNIQDASLSKFYTELDTHLQAQNYHTSLSLTNDIPIREEKILKGFLADPPAAVILVTCQPDNVKCFQRLIDKNVYLIFFERKGLADADHVLFDDRGCAFSLIDSCIKEGKTRNLLFCGPEDFSTESEFVRGFCDAYRGNNLPVNKEDIVHSDFTTGFSFRSFVQKLMAEKEIDTIITTSSMLTDSLQQTLRYLENRFSREPEIISIDDRNGFFRSAGDIGSYSRPTLRAVETILDLLNENLPRMPLLDHKQITLPYESFHFNKKAKTGDSSGNIRVLAPAGTISEGLEFVIPFIENHTGISISLESSPYEEMYETICAHKDDDYYDVYITDIVWFNDLAENGFFLDVTEPLSNLHYNRNDFPTQVLSNFSKCKGRDYAFPFIYTAQLLFYRKDLFENYENKIRFKRDNNAALRPPTNWTEFNAIAKFFTREFNPNSPTEFGTTAGGRYSSAANVEYLTRLWSFQEDLFDLYGDVRINTPNAIRALESYVESHKYASPESKEHWWDEQVSEFSEGRAAMMIMYSSHATPIIDRQTSQIAGNIGFTSVPGEKHTLGGYSIGINANTEQKEASVKFASYLSDDTLAKALTLLGCNAIGLNPADLNDVFDIMPWYTYTLQTAKNSVPRILPYGKRHISYKKAEQIIASAVRDSILSGVTAEDSLNKAQRELEDLLSEKSI